MDDVISRQAALDALNHELICGAVINQCGLEAAYEVIEDLPSAQPEIKQQAINSSDCIDRQAAIDDIWTVSPLAHLDREWIDRWLRQLPSANNSEIPNSSDTISRAKAIDALDKRFDSIPMEQTSEILMLRKDLRNLPPAQPEIIRCRECKFASGDSRICMKFDHSPIGELDFCSFAERREVTE